MSDDLKKGKLSLIGDKPMQLTDSDGGDMPAPTSDQKRTTSIVGKVVRAYRDAAKSLLSEKYSHLRECAPEFLVDPGDVMAVCCGGGVVIRYGCNRRASPLQVVLELGVVAD